MSALPHSAPYRKPLALALILAFCLPLTPRPVRATDTPPAPDIRQVAVAHPKTETWPERIDASGNIMPWHEILISAEAGGLRLVSVLVHEGDTVKKGQVLARFDTASVETDLDVANAQHAEAEALLAQAQATLERANRLAPSGSISRQELNLYETQKHTAEARLNAAKAQVRRQQIKMQQATLSAPDDGLISSASAAEGSIVQSGSELFRLIRQGRLEWRAEVRGEALLRLAAGQEVVVKSPLGSEIKGKIRRVSPTIDIATHNGLVYVDLPTGSELKAGLNVSGSINLGKRKTLVVPSTAIQRQGEAGRVYTVDAENRIAAVDVRPGRTRAGQVEILSGLNERALFVVGDLTLLKEGEAVTIQP